MEWNGMAWNALWSAQQHRSQISGVTQRDKQAESLRRPNGDCVVEMRLEHDEACGVYDDIGQDESTSNLQLTLAFMLCCQQNSLPRPPFRSIDAADSSAPLLLLPLLLVHLQLFYCANERTSPSRAYCAQ